MIYAALILLVGFFIFYILSAFFEAGFRKKKLDAATADGENLLLKKDAILEALRDLEYDFKLQKVSERYYQQLRENLTRDAVNVIKQLETIKGTRQKDAAGITRHPSKTRARARS